jgi:glycerol-3-phosphate O-acyltransferase
MYARPRAAEIDRGQAANISSRRGAPIDLASAPMTLPIWLVILLGFLSAIALLDRLLVPGVRWWLGRRLQRAVDELNRRLFKTTRREVLVDRLAHDPKLIESIDAQARHGDTPREVLHARVRRYAEEIVPSFSAYAYFRAGYAAARVVAKSLYRVRVGYADDEGLSRIPHDASVVFVMNHRSNMDYVLVAYLAADRTALSYAVGEWARIWPLQTLIRAMGAYFVRRDSKDPLYRRVLERWVQIAADAGVVQAIFPEGGLSRDGTLRPPRLGLLGYMLRPFDPRGERDVVFVPVGINYDRVFEDRTQLLAADPERSRPGFGRTIAGGASFVGRNLKLLVMGRWYRFGYACVNFGTPLSLRAWCRERDVDFRGLDAEARMARIGEFGTEIMRRVGAYVPVTPVALVASVLAEDLDRMWTGVELRAAVAARSRELEAAGAHVYVPRDDRDYAIAVGIRMLVLRRVVEEVGEGFRVRTEERRLLEYYANSVGHLINGDCP